MNRNLLGNLHQINGRFAWMVVLLFCVLGAKGQDYTGIYYIANAIWNADNINSEYYWYSASTPEYNWYLVPGADPHLSHYSDAYFNNQYSNTNSSGTADYTGSNYGDPEKPFLTTYRTNRDSNSIWIVKKTGDYYYIIHALTGKYIKYERTYKSFATRKTMHLEDVEGDSPGNVFQYEITTNTNSAQSIIGFNIRCQGLTSGNRHFNPAGDNHPRYYGTNEGNKTPYSSGMVGIWTSTTDGSLTKGSLWPYEDASATLTPIITADNSAHTVTISMPTGYEIYDVYYTTDGSTPTLSSAHATGSATIDNLPADYYGWVKAKAGRFGVLTTTTDSLFVDFNTIAQTTMNISGCDNSITLSCASPETSIYYTLDGSEPTTISTLFTEPFYVADGTTVKSIAYRYTNHSTVATQTVVYTHTSLPTITFSFATLKCILACPDNDATIYYTYTTDGNEPADPNVGNPSQVYSAPIDIPQNATFWIKAVAKNNNLEASCVVENSFTLNNVISDLAGLQGVTGNNHYLMVADIDASGLENSIVGFSGTLESLVKEDGTFCSINNLTKPLFASTDGATICNLTFNNVNITSGTNVGALVAEADGNTRIYNVGILGGSVSGSNNVGGLVGLIKENSSVRVVNCYSYADVSGGTYAAGIVGNNAGTVGDVRIALCMMYGNVTDAANISPVYCGNHVSNSQNFTEYNYWRYRSGMQYTAYNDQMAIEKDDYLTRFPFYCHILNTHRELAAYFLFAANTTQGSVADISQDEIDGIGHWVTKKDIASYPIIEFWEKNTKKVLEAPTPNNILTEMGNNGYLAVTVKIGTNTYSASLPITDMDEANYDYTWGKVVLPFANEFEVNTDYSKICTGWKITGVTGGTVGTFANYNVSDRNCTTKDLYNTTGFIFAQGGNYIVPYGVIAITIEANFANAFYLCDGSYEIGYYKETGESGYSNRTALAGNTQDNFTVGLNTYTIYHTLPAALNAMSASGTTHAQAVVLMGNYHMDSDDLSNYTSKGYTIMSIDADNNQEPDYAIYSNNTQDRPFIPPTRFDFVAFIPLGMSSHVNGAVFYPNTPIWKPRGWFEITETGLIWANQFEIDSGHFNTSDGDSRNYRCIINGGYFTQMVRSRKGACTKLKYYQIGGKAYVKEFYPGNHSANNYANTLVPINVTGGEIEQCFMTGYGKGTVYGPYIYFWCAGGKIGKFLGSYMEKPRQTSGSDGNVNMTAKIDHAIIGQFFGGGTTEKARITGNIDVTINNSRVEFYCGGPEFGNMSEGKTVTTHAFNTTFGDYYGAGFGGTAITYTNDKDDNLTLTNNLIYPNHFNTCYLNSATDVGRLCYKPDYGIGNCYKFEFIMHSRGHKGVARFYTGYASFSLATTGTVENVLDSCTVLNSFYGAGCQGMVNGTVTSTLTDCTVLGSAFGGGYKAAANEVDVYPTTQPGRSVFTGETGIFSDFGTVAPETFTWEQGTDQTNNTADEGNKILYTGTDVTMSDLGNVTGDIKITLDGHTIVHGDVFGGGHESKALNGATVTIMGASEVKQNVFGGGNMASVGINTTGIPGNTTVKLQDGVKVLGKVYGGGNEGSVGGDSKVIIEDEPVP